MQELKIQNLMARCIKYSQDNCYTESRISKYKSLWRTGIVRYLTEHDIDTYTFSVGVDFKSTCYYNGEVRPQEREKVRSIQVLDDMLSLGYIRKRCFTPIFHALDGTIGHEMEKLITHLTNLRRSQTTIKYYRLYLSEFLTHLTVNNIKTVNEIAEKHILTFISSHPTSKVNIISALRVLFRFWKENSIIDGRFDDLFDTYKVRKKERIPSFYTTTEVITVEQSVSRSSGIGKRNYAMVLLASRLGLRASDIANLQFSHINWDNDLITIIMQRTGKTIELPLLTDVGNAIINYLQHGRPQSDLKYIFLYSRAPYVAATNAMVCSAINTIICKSGVDITAKHHGPHSLRHSLASAMLENGTMIPVISESLGHRSTETTMTYLKIDFKSLIQCAIEVPPVPEDFYQQRGGAFYG